MKHCFHAILCLCFFANVSAQYTVPPEYHVFVRQADSLYKTGAWKESAMTYSAAFATLGGKGFLHDRYAAARSWTLSAYPDSAFFNLERIAKAGWNEYDYTLSDTSLTSLHTDARWKPLLDTIFANKEKSEEGLNKPLVHLLDSLKKEDQKWRNYYRMAGNNEIKDDTLSEDEVWIRMAIADSLNYLEAQKILREYGYPNYDLAGTVGSNNFWLLIQHQDRHPEFQDSVLQLMKVEVDKGKASSMDYAYLVDRVKVNTGQLQVYGTQMQLNADSSSYEPKPLEDPEHVNERRKSVGLPPIEDYIIVMNERFHGSLRKNEY